MRLMPSDAAQTDCARFCLTVAPAHRARFAKGMF